MKAYLRFINFKLFKCVGLILVDRCSMIQPIAATITAVWRSIMVWNYATFVRGILIGYVPNFCPKATSVTHLSYAFYCIDNISHILTNHLWIFMPFYQQTNGWSVQRRFTILWVGSGTAKMAGRRRSWTESGRHDRETRRDTGGGETWCTLSGDEMNIQYNP